MATINAGQLAGNFEDVAALTGQKVSVGSIVRLFDGSEYLTSLVDEGGAIPLAGGVFANVIPPTGVEEAPDDGQSYNRKNKGWSIAVTGGGGLARTPISGVVTIPADAGFFATANSTITMPDVTAFTGGESFSIVAAIAATASTLTVDGTQGEEIAPRTGDTPETVFDLTTVGVSFEFIFNAITGNWEV